MNKTENTPENKAVFFANYPSVKIVFGLNRDELEGIIWTKQQIFLAKRTEGTRSTEYFIDYPECYTELRSLSQITDEDAIEVAKICSHYFPINEDVECEVFINSFGRKVVSWGKSYKEKFLVEHAKDATQGADFLRSKGYLLPWRDLSVEEIISYGWAKYENQ